MQNLVVFMEPTEKAHSTPIKTGNMILNRFCIDEDTAFELYGVNYLKKINRKMTLDAKKNQCPKQAKRKGVFVLMI